MQNFGQEDYQSFIQTWSVAQDRRGMVYIGSNDGVLEFDGTRWRMIEIQHARHVAADSEGTIFVGADNEFGYLSPDSTGTMRYVSLARYVNERSKVFGYVLSICIMEDGVFFLTKSHLFRWSSMQLREICPGFKFLKAFSAKGTLFIQEEQQGLMELKGDSLRQVPDAEIFKSVSTYFILEPNLSDTSKLIIGTAAGLLKYDGITFQRFRTDADEFIQANRLQHGTRLRNNLIALSTTRGGVIIIDNEGRIHSVLDKSTGLNDARVHYVYQDRERGLWMALNKGAARYEIESPLSLFTRVPGLESGTAAIQRHKNILYASTGMGVYYLQPASSAAARARFLPVEGISAPGMHMLSVGELLFACTSEGLYEIRGNRARLVTSGVADCLYRSKFDSSKVFVGFKDGLGLLTIHDGKYTFAGKFPSINDYVRFIAEDADSTLWLGTYSHGVLNVRFSTDVPSQYSSLRSPVNIRKYSDVNGNAQSETFVFDFQNKVFFSKNTGLFSFNTATETFIPDSTFGKEFADTLTAFGTRKGVDRYGNIWLRADVYGEKQIGVLRPQLNGTYAWQNLQLYRALDFDPIWTIYADEDAPGVVWFGGAEGVLRYDSLSTIVHHDEYSSFIRSVNTNGDSMVFGGTEVSTFTTPVLPYEQNNISFEFSATSFDGIRETRFQYILEGLETDWSEWTKQPMKEYTLLPAGEYSFRVKAINSYGIHSKEAVFSFSILPPFWETWWFRLLAIGITGLAGFTLVSKRISFLKKEHQRQEEFSRQTLAHLEAERKRIAGEIHDQLGQNILLVKSKLYFGKSSLTNAHDMEKLLDETSENLSDILQDARELSYQLHPHILEELGLTKALHSISRRASDASGIQFSVQGVSIDRFVSHDVALTLFRIVQECVNNIIKHSHATVASLSIQQKERTITVTIHDNGNGIQIEKRGSVLTPGGFGIKNMKERARLHGGEVIIESPPEGGTTINVHIPYNEGV